MSSIYRALSSKSAKQSEDKQTHVNKQRVLLMSSRGVTFRHRHLIQDLHSLLPHSRREPKLDTKKNINVLNDIAELYNCNNIMYFESRKHQDLYLWLSKPPNGPTFKFHLQNLHTYDELNFTGNCLKGSRPVLSFDEAFEKSAHFKLLKELFIHVFGVPPRARKSKPFIDHVMSFSIVDNKIWVRNYQVNESAEVKEDETAKDEMTLVEIGPRFVMTLITVLEGSFGGPKIYENKEYVSPNFVRAQIKHQLAQEATKKGEQAAQRRLKKIQKVKENDPLQNEVLFK